MSKGKHSEVEMIGALKQLEAGRTAAEIGRETGERKVFGGNGIQWRGRTGLR